MKFVCYLLVAGIFGLQSCVACEETGKAIQIVVPVNHAFQLQTNELKPILENENIKDRQVVVVSIAGALRQGKSFLLNFFLKYLYAQVSLTLAFLKLNWISIIFQPKIFFISL